MDPVVYSNPARELRARLLQRRPGRPEKVTVVDAAGQALDFWLRPALVRDKDEFARMTGNVTRAKVVDGQAQMQPVELRIAPTLAAVLVLLLVTEDGAQVFEAADFEELAAQLVPEEPLVEVASVALQRLNGKRDASPTLAESSMGEG